MGLLNHDKTHSFNTFATIYTKLKIDKLKSKEKLNPVSNLENDLFQFNHNFYTHSKPFFTTTSQRFVLGFDGPSIGKESAKLFQLEFHVWEGKIFLGSDLERAFVIDFLNADAFLAFDYKTGYGAEIGGSVLSIGYDGKYVDSNVNFLTFKLVAKYQDGILQLGIGALIGWDVSLDLEGIWNEIIN